MTAVFVHAETASAFFFPNFSADLFAFYLAGTHLRQLVLRILMSSPCDCGCVVLLLLPYCEFVHCLMHVNRGVQGAKPPSDAALLAKGDLFYLRPYSTAAVMNVFCIQDGHDV